MNPITSKPQTLELFAAPGCLPEAKLEAEAIAASPWKPLKFQPSLEVQKGFVRVQNASWDFACELVARAATLHDLRLVFPKSRVHGWNDLPRVLGRFPWGALLPDSANLEFRVEAFAGVMPHAGRIQKIAEELFTAHGFRLSGHQPPIRIHLTSSGDDLRVGVSLGHELHKRGWRASTGTLAPLREDLAAAALWRLKSFEPRLLEVTQVAVPFAGSGTLGIEAWHVLGLPPVIWGAERSWQRLCSPEAKTLGWWQKRISRAAQNKLPELMFVESDAVQFAELEGNMARVAQTIQSQVTLHHADAFQQSFLSKDGLVLLPLHPPYGLRLSSDNPEALYAKLGKAVQTWSLETQLIGFCLCPSESTWRVFRAGLGNLRLETSHFTQGGLDVRLCCFSNL